MYIHCKVFLHLQKRAGGRVPPALHFQLRNLQCRLYGKFKNLPRYVQKIIAIAALQ